MIIIAVIAGALILGALAIMFHPAFGGIPSGTRMERMRRSPHFNDGKFQNLEPTAVMTSEENMMVSLWKSIFPGVKDYKPSEPLPAVKTNLNTLDLDRDQIVWFGHSSYLLILGGRKILVDPVLTNQFPSNLMMSPFKGTDIYTPADMPPIDILLITHDHYDHLDYGTVKALKDRVKLVVCPLGVGAHLARWGYTEHSIVELDWGERRTFGNVKITALPARHFSGRFFWRNNTLWASYMLRSPGMTVFVAGDGGFGNHFHDIAKKFPDIDLALIEAGQYDNRWSKIHTMPQEEDSVVAALHPAIVIPVHNGKYALARHPWNEPIETMRSLAHRDTSFLLAEPVIGKPLSIIGRAASEP